MINFHYETDFKLDDETAYRKWLGSIIMSERRKTGEINIIFSDDKTVHKINNNYLNHNTLTDIISFDYSHKDTLGADIFISVERVQENAKDYNVSFQQELLRVMAHGILHCCGYNDKTEEEITIMRAKEEEKIKMFHVEHS